MLETNFELARSRMVDHQLRGWDVLDPAVIEVMDRLPRERFTPEHYRNLAYADSEIPIGNGQLMLRPSVQARLLQAAQVRRADRVLEVGSGTGYLTACLAALGGNVRTAEIHEALAQTARADLVAEGFDSVEVMHTDMHTLDEVSSDYDVILVTGSLPEPDSSFGQHLAPGGRLVWVLGGAPAMRVELITRVSVEEWSREGLFETMIPPLEGVTARRRFEF